MKMLAIDPGPENSAFVEWDGRRVGERGKVPNQSMFSIISDARAEWIVIEQVAAMGMPVGVEVFETVFWSGRFAEHSLETGQFDRMKRHEVKMHLCGNTRAKDGNIRQSLIDRFGPGDERAIGKKKTPGPLYGISGDIWQALALAVTYWDVRIVLKSQANTRSESA